MFIWKYKNKFSIVTSILAAVWSSSTFYILILIIYDGNFQTNEKKGTRRRNGEKKQKSIYVDFTFQPFSFVTIPLLSLWFFFRFSLNMNFWFGSVRPIQPWSHHHHHQMVKFLYIQFFFSLRFFCFCFVFCLPYLFIINILVIWIFGWFHTHKQQASKH